MGWINEELCTYDIMDHIALIAVGTASGVQPGGAVFLSLVPYQWVNHKKGFRA